MPMSIHPFCFELTWAIHPIKLVHITLTASTLVVLDSEHTSNIKLNKIVEEKSKIAEHIISCLVIGVTTPCTTYRAEVAGYRQAARRAALPVLFLLTIWGANFSVFFP